MGSLIPCSTWLMLKLIHLTGMEKSLTKQYQDASNISARINLHRLYSQNPKGWFSWIYEQAHISPNDHILEIGCGDGSLWSANLSRMPEKISIILSDISEGMLRDARRWMQVVNLLCVWFPVPTQPGFNEHLFV